MIHCSSIQQVLTKYINEPCKVGTQSILNLHKKRQGTKKPFNAHSQKWEWTMCKSVFTNGNEWRPKSVFNISILNHDIAMNHARIRAQTILISFQKFNSSYKKIGTLVYIKSSQIAMSHARICTRPINTLRKVAMGHE